MSKLENLSEEDKTKLYPKIKAYDCICRYNPKQRITKSYHKTYCENCNDGIIHSGSRRVGCSYYKKD